jgi:hypothetical protein
VTTIVAASVVVMISVAFAKAAVISEPEEHEQERDQRRKEHAYCTRTFVGALGRAWIDFPTIALGADLPTAFCA